MTLAGFPATIEFGGTSLVTTEPAAIIEFLPIFCACGKTIALAPIQTLSFITLKFFFGMDLGSNP